MFQFKGTAAAEASINAKERDWRVADHCNIQQLGKRPFTAMVYPTLHQRSLTEDTRRPSVLTFRSRSNSSIAGQTFPERPISPAHFPVDRPTPRTSTDRRSVSGETVHARTRSTDGFGKTLMAKGSRLLRRQNSKHDLTCLQTLDWLEDANGREPVRESSYRRDSRHSGIRSRDDDAPPRPNISEPFNFQHLTHTTPQHVQRIQQQNHNYDLVSEFSALRASQAPRRELRGIKTIDIQQGIYFSETSASETSSPPGTGYSMSPPGSPARYRRRMEHPLSSPSSPVRTLGNNKSIENFSQPSPSYHTAHSSPISPPPRSSSRNFAPDFFTFHQEPSPETPSKAHTAIEGAESPSYPTATWNDTDHDLTLPHAVTTPDDTAHLVRALPFSMIRTELAGVPEEDELSEGKRSSIATSIVRPSTPTSSVRHAKSFPSTKPSPHRWSGVLPQTSEEDDECLPRQSLKSLDFAVPLPEEHTADVPERPHYSRRISMRREESWEDVIDYCYEHEAEADCNFDWDLASNPEEQSKRFGTSVSEHTNVDEQKIEDPIEASSDQNRTAPRRSSSNYSASPPLLLPLQTFIPELQLATANSIESSYSSISEAVTPLPVSSTMTTKSPDTDTKNWSMPTTDSTIILHDESASESLFDDLYQEMLASHATTDSQLPFNIGRVDGSTISNSPRSSRSPISKSSSQESFWYSQANNAARRHCNTGSVGSLPDLIQSKNIEKVEPVNDESADQTAMLNVVDASAEASQRRRSSTLAKDVVLKAMLSKAIAREDRDASEVPLPLHPAFREKACSDAFPLVMGSTMPPPPPPQPVFARRMRSTSSVSSLSSRKSNRASYSLFPSPAVR